MTKANYTPYTDSNTDAIVAKWTANKARRVEVYPDSKAGVMAMLNAESNLTLDGEETYTPDPEVDGVWSVTHIDGAKNDDAVQCIAYLAGYATPFGDTRQDNDFECEYLD